jgi:hypothetical protein
MLDEFTRAADRAYVGAARVIQHMEENPQEYTHYEKVCMIGFYYTTKAMRQKRNVHKPSNNNNRTGNSVS